MFLKNLSVNMTRKKLFKMTNRQLKFKSKQLYHMFSQNMSRSTTTKKGSLMYKASRVSKVRRMAAPQGV
uniref:Putative ovule protein n=1 Tax=Solanum chacoense TaxID=4108 RepID=A0A0V0GXW4_SOLCH